MIRHVTMTLAAAMLMMGSTGCMSRMIHEGMGAATGASGKVVTTDTAADLTQYKSLRVEGITIAPRLQAPAQMPSLVGKDLSAAAAARGLAPEGLPRLNLTAEIIHYETGGTVDTAIGPLEEVVVRTKLIDAQSGKVIAEANLIGRSKATTSSGPKNLAGGVGKAMDRWMKDAGLRKIGEKERD